VTEERKLATIQRVKSVVPVPNSDKLDLVHMEDNGWQVVCQKGLHEVGNLVCYIETDAWVPTHLAPWLTKPGHQPKTFRGVEGERLKTIRLRGTLSQGVILPLTDVHKDVKYIQDDSTFGMSAEYAPTGKRIVLRARENATPVGTDLTEFLGVIKYEKPLPGELIGKARGNFPSFIPKTDQERVQNLWGKLQHRREQFPDELFEVTEKLDGSSMTVYISMEGRFGVCSRNWDLDLEAGGETHFARAASDMDVFMKTVREEMIAEVCTPWGFALQGELVGPGVQGNKYDLRELEFRVFDFFDIEDQEYNEATLRETFVYASDLKHVPVIETRKLDFETIQDILAYADGPSSLNPKVMREGVVFKSLQDPSFSFKVISNEWLLKNE